MQRIRIKHLTEYIFQEQVVLNPHRLLLRPREGHDVRIESSILRISPDYTIKWYRDVYDNSLASVFFTKPTSNLTIASEVVIQHYEEAPLDFFIEDYAIQYPFQYEKAEWTDLSSYQQPVFAIDQPIVNDWLQKLYIPMLSIKTFTLLLTLNQLINQRFNYKVREEAGVQSPAQTIILGSGSCRDYATLFIEACRSLGLASRFVSGYLHASATEAGNASTHAWAEVYLPGTGWKGFDPTSGEVTGLHHIAVAVARNPEAVPPVTGSFIGTNYSCPTMNVNVQVNLLIP